MNKSEYTDQAESSKQFIISNVSLEMGDYNRDIELLRNESVIGRYKKKTKR